MSKSNRLTRQTKVSPRKFGENGKRAKQARNRINELTTEAEVISSNDNIALVAAAVTMLMAAGLVFAGMGVWSILLVVFSFGAMAKHRQLKDRLMNIEAEIDELESVIGL